MKIAAISDLHLDINRDFDVLGKLVEILNGVSAGMLLAAGDISEDFRKTVRVMEEFEKMSGIRTFYVPGNHDLWSPDPHNYRVDYIYSAFKDDERCLSGKVIEEDGFSIIGDVGWYDYSFGNHERFSLEMFDRMSYMNRTWQDAYKNPWTRDNIRQNEIMLSSIENALKKAGSRNIIAVTHMLPIREFTVLDARPEWEYFNAFLGSEKLGQLFEKYSVRYSVSGHVHYRKEMMKNGISYICPCLGYHSEWRYAEGHEDDLEYHLRDALRIFTV